jgi:hypothetical protein
MTPRGRWYAASPRGECPTGRAAGAAGDDASAGATDVTAMTAATATATAARRARRLWLLNKVGCCIGCVAHFRSALTLGLPAAICGPEIQPIASVWPNITNCSKFGKRAVSDDDYPVRRARRTGPLEVRGQSGSAGRRQPIHARILGHDRRSSCRPRRAEHQPGGPRGRIRVGAPSSAWRTAEPATSIYRIQRINPSHS